ncbi:MAG: hypothetical protein ACE5JS_22840 [Nitrospinota bacterium]
MPEGNAAIRVLFFLLGAALIVAGCGALLRDEPPASGEIPRPPQQSWGNGKSAGSSDEGVSAGENGVQVPQGSEFSLAVLRRDRDRLKREVDQLRSERDRRDAERRLSEDFLADLFRAIEKENYPQALSSLDRFLRSNPGHPLSRRVSEIRPAVEKLQSMAAEREGLREEIRKLKEIQIHFDTLRKQGL